ncbi:polymorphic toxin-type HINT domain-containing protein [Kitasatospora aureofaciens]|uniref:polymorphic toxin-type HINT domain-containing protein n=1 Tax=Kitasatospora aureofaciens TaxID=1894 RepID=UPI0033EAE5F8
MAIAKSADKLEKRLAAETASVGTADRVRAFLATGQYPGKDDDDRVQLARIMDTGGPGVKAAASKALDGTIDDVRAFLATGQYRARDDDNRVLVAQALDSGGPEVKAAAQAVLSGPADRLVPFLQSGLPKARQRDAMTAAHVATVAAYLATIDGSVAQARQYAAQAAQSYATARGAANEAAGYANQASQSSQQAQGFANQAAQSAQAAQVSAQQAAQYAKQAQTSAATANAAARSASTSAAMATGYANQASTYAADAKTASDQAKASAAAAAKSRDEANKAADEAIAAVFTKQQDDSTDGKLQNATATVDDQGRISYIDAVPQGDPKTDIVKDDLSRCEAGDMMLSAYGNVMKPLDPTVWHNDASGKPVCTITLTVKATGTTDYYMKTCPEPNLTIAACRGKYTTWNTVLLNSSPVDAQYTQTVDITYAEYVKKYRPKVDTGQILYDMTIGDFVKCYNDPGFNASCGMAVANAAPFIPALAKSVKAVVAFRYALTTGVGIEDAKLAVQASLDGYNKAALAKLTATADAVAKFRNTLKDGIGTDAALEALRQDQNIERALVEQAENEATIAAGVRTECRFNSFPASTEVLLADGSHRAIGDIRTGIEVMATDPSTGERHAQPVTATFAHATERLVGISLTDGSTLSTTAGHFLYVEGKGWVVASALVANDRLRTAGGSLRTVGALQDRPGLAPQSVYDLTVGGLHTFYVRATGDQGQDLLVHNCLNIVADEGTSEAHTLSQHVNISGQRLIDKVTKDGVASVWADQQTAVRAVQKAFDQWYANGTNAQKLADWITKQERRGKNAPFDPTRDTKSFTWALRDEGSLGTTYTKNPVNDPAKPLVDTPTGNNVVITLKYVRGHPQKFVVYTAYPK